MHAQLQRLANIAELPNVTIQVVPLKGNHGLAVDSFAILQFGKAHETTLHDVVSLEHLKGELYVEGDTDTYQFGSLSATSQRNPSPLGKPGRILTTATQVWN